MFLCYQDWRASWTPQVQFRAEWRNLDCTKPVHDEIWSSAGSSWEKGGYCWVSYINKILCLWGLLSPLHSYVILDTPGQIEIFTWSASGAIITDAVASSFPTVVAYIIDTPRTTAPATFMSNMLYACRCADFYSHNLHITHSPHLVFSTKQSFLSFWFSTRRMSNAMNSRWIGCKTSRHSKKRLLRTAGQETTKANQLTWTVSWTVWAWCWMSFTSIWRCAISL